MSAEVQDLGQPAVAGIEVSSGLGDQLDGDVVRARRVMLLEALPDLRVVTGDDKRVDQPVAAPSVQDMHYSFILGSRGLPMVPVPSLDSAEVPGSVTAQVQQAARWFFGPARFARYLKDPAACAGWPATVMAASAAGSAAEWAGCAVVPAVVCVLIAGGTPPVRVTAGCYLVSRGGARMRGLLAARNARGCRRHSSVSSGRSPDLWLQGLALELIPGDELAGYWSGRDVGFGTFRPVRPVLDAAERGLLTAIRLVLSGLG